MAAPGAEFTEAVLAVVARIPPGRAMAYSDVAAVLGSRAARGVGQVMALAGGSVPWWRVVRASGHVAPGLEARALAEYERERMPLRPTTNGTVRVDLSRARWMPELDELD